MSDEPALRKVPIHSSAIYYRRGLGPYLRTCAQSVSALAEFPRIIRDGKERVTPPPHASYFPHCTSPYREKLLPVSGRIVFTVRFRVAREALAKSVYIPGFLEVGRAATPYAPDRPSHLRAHTRI